LNGGGNIERGARWNPPRGPAVYTSLNLSLAVLELLVHTDRDLLPNDLQAVQLELPPNNRPQRIRTQSLPLDWRQPSGRETLRERGKRWLTRGERLCLSVPSVIVPTERNLIINPQHPAMRYVRVASITPFALDERLVA
jgi:RES domain-containing protein